MNKQTLMKILCEEFVGTVEVRKEKYSIYKNPTSKDWNDLVMEQHQKNIDKHYLSVNPKLCRFIIDFKDKAVYVHSANIIHNTAASVIGLKNYNDAKYASHFFAGTARIDGGKMSIVGSDFLEFFDYEEGIAEKLIKNKFEFTMKYFDTDVKSWLKIYTMRKNRPTGDAINIRDMRI